MELSDSLSKREILIQNVGNFGKIGVIIFVLITGYYLEKQSFKISKLFRLSNSVRFYSLISFFVWLLVDKTTDSIKENFFDSLFPIVFQRYWFVTSYVVLMLVQPIIKNYLQNEPREKQLKYFLILIVTFYMSNWVGIVFNIEGYFLPSETFSFLVIALGGHLVRIYQEELHGRLFKIVWGTFGFTLVLILLKPIIVFYYSQQFALPDSFLTGMASVNAVLFSISVFILVTKIKFKKLDWITKISSVTFDVYLIHDNNIFRPLIWTVIFENAAFLDSPWLFSIVIFEPLLVFITCVGLAKIRVALFKPFANILQKISTRCAS